MRHDTRLDGVTSMFLEQQLQSLDPIQYRELQPSLMGLRIASRVANVAAYDESYKYAITSLEGFAKIIGPDAKDLPRVTVNRTPAISPIVPLGASFGWPLHTVRAAQAKNVPLEDETIAAAVYTVDRKCDEMITFGNGTAVALGSIRGLVNNSAANGGDILNSTPGSKTGGGDWLSATTPPDEIIADVRLMLGEILAALKMGAAAGSTMPMFEQFALYIPVPHHIALLRPRASTADTSVLNWILEQMRPYVVAIEPWWRLDDAAPGASSGKGMAIMVPAVAGGAVHPMAGQTLLPLDFTQEPYQYNGLDVSVPCSARCGGFVNRYPVAFRTMYGAGFDA